MKALRARTLLATALACAALVAVPAMSATDFASRLLGGTTDKPLPPGAGDAGKAYRAGLEALRRNDLDAAAAQFRAAAQAAPAEAAPWLALAEIALRRGDKAGAEAQVEQALKVAPRSALAYSARAHLLSVKGDFRAALATLDKAIELDPRSPILRNQRGDLYATALRDRNRAMAEYRAALALDPNDARAHYALGGLLVQAGRYADARSELVRATQLAPGNGLAWAALGAAQAGLGDNQLALVSYDTALKILPALPTAHIGRGDILVAQGRVDEAIAAYEQALKSAPRQAWLLARLGSAQEKARRTAQAEKYYRAALAIEPRNLVATNNLAFLLADEKRDLDEALRLATIAVETAPPSSETTWDTLAWVRRARGELADAAKILEPLASSARNPALVYHLGVVYADMGRRKDALDMLDKALKLAPDYAPAQEAKRKLAAAG